MEKLTVAASLRGLSAAGTTYARQMEKAGFDVGLYKPEGSDGQTPHVRDEIYVIATGTGMFHCAGEGAAFASGDVFFVPAGTEHRFVDFSADFSTWVIFLGARPKT